MQDTVFLFVIGVMHWGPMDFMQPAQCTHQADNDV